MKTTKSLCMPTSEWISERTSQIQNPGRLISKILSGLSGKRQLISMGRLRSLFPAETPLSTVQRLSARHKFSSARVGVRSDRVGFIPLSRSDRQISVSESSETDPGI